MCNSFPKLFERNHPFSVAYYIGRKNTQRILGCKIKNKSELIAE